MHRQSNWQCYRPSWAGWQADTSASLPKRRVECQAHEGAVLRRRRGTKHGAINAVPFQRLAQRQGGRFAARFQRHDLFRAVADVVAERAQSLAHLQRVAL